MLNLGLDTDLEKSMLRLVICNMGYAGYSAACWRELAARPDVHLHVYTPETHYRYAPNVIDGLPVTVIPDTTFLRRGFAKDLANQVLLDNADAIVIGGWSGKPFRALAFDARLNGVRKLLAFDTMWQWNWRCLLARFRLHSLLKHVDGVVVAGERGRIFARYIGVRPDHIFTSTYGYDAEAFAKCMELRKSRYAEWPRRFVFVGRYASVKGVDTLLSAYRQYRDRVQSPWELHCYGNGPLAEEMACVEGVVDHGFLQPEKLPEALVDAGVLVLPSLRDPWGVALAEGAGAGLPLIASAEVSSSIDLVRHLYNGVVVPAGNTERLCNALCWMHINAATLPEMGRNSQTYAGAYTPKVWADRILEAVTEK